MMEDFAANLPDGGVKVLRKKLDAFRLCWHCPVSPMMSVGRLCTSRFGRVKIRHRRRAELPDGGYTAQ